MTNIEIRQSKNRFYNELVSDLIQEMENGNTFWEQPWFVKSPTNFKTKKRYKGINIINLNFYAQKNGFNSHYWITEKQAISLGGRIKNSELGNNCFVIMAKWESKSFKTKTGDTYITCWLMIRSYPIYNIEQTIGLENKSFTQQLFLFDKNPKAEIIVKNYKNAPEIIFGGDSAFYMPGYDIINIPHLEDFKSTEEYYCTLFHEMIHSTGHPSRLNRQSFSEKIKFGDENYAKEEIIAEFGAAFLCGICGFFYRTKKNSAAYLNSWLKGLVKDNTLLFRSASGAQKAVDYILGEDLTDENSEPTLFDYNLTDINWAKEAHIEWI